MNSLKPLEEEFGVSAAAQVAVVAGAADAAPLLRRRPMLPLSSRKLALTRWQLSRLVKEITGLGLKESKEIVDAAPKAVKKNVPYADAEAMKATLEAAGAVVELKYFNLEQKIGADFFGLLLLFYN